MRRGEIYLVNFGKKYNSESAKTHPALIIQNDIANRNIDKVAFKGITLLPPDNATERREHPCTDCAQRQTPSRE